MAFYRIHFQQSYVNRDFRYDKGKQNVQPIRYRPLVDQFAYQMRQSHVDFLPADKQ
ncbi:hypothetical protein D3C73_523360 [compost metagenome]